MLQSPPDQIDLFLDDVFTTQADVKLAGYRTADGIVRFVREVLGVDGKTPADPNYLAPYQEDILRHFVTHKRVAMRGPHGIGKTTTTAWIVLWGIAVFEEDTKIATTASQWRQLIHFTWPEIRKWARKADWGRLGLVLRDGQELLERQIKLPNKEAFAIASDTPSAIEGAHAAHLIYMFDEAKAIPNAIFDAAEGAFSTGDCYAFAASTPGEPNGRFYDIHTRKAGTLDWWVRHVTLEEAVAAGRVNQAWADQRKEQWGEQSAVYQNRVLGEFAASGGDAVIPLAWVELSNERWRACDGKGTGTQQFGVDVAWTGEDQSVIARRTGLVVETLEHLTQLDPMEVSGKVIIQVGRNKALPVLVDVIGIGAGVVARLREQGYAVGGVNVSESAKDIRGKDLTDSSGELTFINMRAYGWWLIRERLDPKSSDPIALPPNDRLTGDLTAPRWKTTSAGRIQVESKDDIRKRLGRSTDDADAVINTLLPPELFQKPKGFIFA